MTKKNYNLENLFKALADRTRLRLISLIGDSEVCVCFFVAILKTSQPKISRHLAYLRRAGVVTARREGKWMHYRIVTPPEAGAAEILQRTLDWLSENRVMQADRGRLAKACCAPQKLIALQGAPRPAALTTSQVE